MNQLALVNICATTKKFLITYQVWLYFVHIKSGFYRKKIIQNRQCSVISVSHKSLCMQVEEAMVPKGLQSTIRLKGTAQRQDSARFQCLARNDFGSNKTDINFVVQVHINNLFLEMRFPKGHSITTWTR